MWNDIDIGVEPRNTPAWNSNDSDCWRALARQLPILYRQSLSDVRLKTCAVDCVFYVQVFRGACECTWKYRSISSSSPAKLEIKDTINEVIEIRMSVITCVSTHEGHEWFSNGSRKTQETGRRDFHVFGCSVYVSNFADSRMEVPRYR